MNNELIQLITVKGYEKDESGFKEKELTDSLEIFASVKSVGRTEYYEALRSGMNVNIIFSVNPDDFDLATKEVDGKKIKASKVIHDGATYIIRRTYKKDLHVLELSCEEVE